MKTSGTNIHARKKKMIDTDIVLPYEADMTLEQEAFHVVKFLHLVMDSSQDAKRDFLRKVVQ